MSLPASFTIFYSAPLPRVPHAAPLGLVTLGHQHTINMPRLTALKTTKTGMPNTYTQIYIQIVFAVEGRQNLIAPDRKEELQKYITGIITRQNQKLLAIHCM